MMSDYLVYKVGTNAKALELEKELLKELADLKNEIEDTGLDSGNKLKSLRYEI